MLLPHAPRPDPVDRMVLWLLFASVALFAVVALTRV